MRVSQVSWLTLRHRYLHFTLGAILLIAVVAWPRPVTVVEVIDGDTVRLADGELVRLLGIDTPEHEEPYWEEATTFLSDLVNNREVNLTFDYTRRDHYRRLLGYLWLGDTLVNLLMIRAGLARVYAWPPDTLLFRRLVAAQTDARKARRGIWSLPPPRPESLYVINRTRFRFHRPACKSVRADDERTALPRDSLLNQGLCPCRTCKP